MFLFNKLKIKLNKLKIQLNKLEIQLKHDVTHKLCSIYFIIAMQSFKLL